MHIKKSKISLPIIYLTFQNLYYLTNMFAFFSIVLCSVGVGALSSREAEGRANMSANEKVKGLCFRGCCISLQNIKAFSNLDFRRPINYYSQQTKL